MKVSTLVLKPPKKNIFKVWPSDELSQLDVDLVKPINFYSLSLYIRYTNTFQPAYRFDQCTNIFFPILTIKLLL